MRFADLTSTIIGVSGRSGTNLLLDILDCHPDTHCRNEPNLLDNPLGRLFPDGGHYDRRAIDDAELDAALHETCMSHGSYDRLNRTDKSYIPSEGLARIGLAVLRKQKVKRAIGLIDRDYRENEWPCKPPLFDRATLETSHHVLKMISIPRALVRMHDTFPKTRIVHVIRNPADYVASWHHRYVKLHPGGEEAVFRDSMPLVRMAWDTFGRPERDFPFTRRNLLASELWIWRRANEIVYTALKGSDRYLMLNFEDVMQDRRAAAETLFAFSGLDMTAPAHARAESLKNKLFKPRNRKKSAFEDDMDSALSEILEGSALNELPLDPRLADG